MATDLSFQFEWLDPQGAKGEELRATWARLEIRADGEPITRVFDRRAGTVRDSIYAPLYPLAEWFASQWWSLCFEVEGQHSLSDDFYRLRHSLTKSRDGYTFPAMVCESEIDQVRISWMKENLPAHRAEFISEGSIYIPISRFQDALAEFIDAVSSRLEERAVSGTFLQEEWRAIQDADEEEQAFCSAAAALGLDPYSLDDDLRSEVVDAGNKLPQSVQKEFFAAADSRSLQGSVAQLVAALDKVRGTRAQLQSLVDFRDHIRGQLRAAVASKPMPWLSGYEAARLVRSELSLDGKALRSWEEMGQRFGLATNELKNSIVEVQLPVDAAVEANALGSPGFALRSERPEAALRFHFCRALLEFLAPDEPHAALVTSASSHAQKMNRAFAAELLAPASGIKQRLQGDFVSSEELDELAAQFGVSQLVILRQIQNHHLARISFASQ